MAKAVVRDGKISLVLPASVAKGLGVADGGDVALYELRPGVYAVARRGEAVAREIAEGNLEVDGVGAEKATKSSTIGNAELAVVRKLEAVRFDQRTPKKVAEVLGEAERRVLQALVDSGAIRFFKSEKYKDGVYNIPKEIYEIARGASAVKAVPDAKEKEISAGAGTAALPSKTSTYADPEESLEKMGYVIVERESEAKALSERLAPKIKSGEMMGVRGFDKRFYLARKGFYVATSERIFKVMRGGKDRNAEELAREAKIKKEECEAVLNLMREEGEVVEKKRGTYALA